MGKNVETQANTLAEKLANKVDGNYKLLHIPDNLSDKAMSTIIQEKDIRDILDTVYNANILIHGIGRADEMSRRRGLAVDEISKIECSEAVGEAFGYYYDKKGNIVHSTPSIGIRNQDIGKIDTVIGVAGGRDKAEAIISIQKNYHNSVLVTDEGAAREVIEFLK
jgi:central glycolytic genes regulator